MDWLLNCLLLFSRFLLITFGYKDQKIEVIEEFGPKDQIRN